MPESVSHVDSAEILARVLVTVAFDENTVADHTVKAVEAGKLWYLHGLYLQAQGAGGQTVIVKSGSTAVSGATAISTSALREFQLPASTVPHMKGLASGDDLVIALSAAEQVTGWLLYALGEPIQ